MQPEIVSHIFSFLEDNDLVSASGVCWEWYSTASRELKLRSKALYRWPGEPPTSANTLCVVGEKGMIKLLQICKGIRTLEFSFDEPSKTPSKVITKAGEINLKKLVLRNVIFNGDNARALLSTEIPFVEIHTKYRKHLTKKSKKMLMDNKELFAGIVLSNQQPHSSFCGTYPNPLVHSHCDTLHHGRVFLEAAGVTHIRFSNSLVHLNISSGFHLTEKDFLELSALNLRTLVVSDCNLTQDEWSSSFQAGFISLAFLSLTDCGHLGLNTIRHISNKTNLTHLVLDLCHLPQIDECIQILQDSVNLTRLNLICDQASRFTERTFHEKKWKKLKEIVIRNYSFTEIEKNLLKNLVQKYKLNDILVKYYNNYTLRKTKIYITKNLLPVLVD